VEDSEIERLGMRIGSFPEHDMTRYDEMITTIIEICYSAKRAMGRTASYRLWK